MSFLTSVEFSMLEATGDLWTYPADVSCVTTNGVVVRGRLVMGDGVALQAAQRFPQLPAKLGRYVQLYGNRAFYCFEERLLTLPTKEDWRNNSTLELIERSVRQIVVMVDKYPIRSVALPQPGCGCGGLSWK